MVQGTFPVGSTALERAARRRSRAPPPLSVVHAQALHQPVPPVEYDAEGYPFSDGHFEMEGDYHSHPLHSLFDALRTLYEGREDVYYAFDMGLFFEQGNRRAVVVPDLFVVFGAAKRSRNSYKLWEEPKVPDFVMEVISEDSLKKDVEYKPPLYAALGVTEYWTFDSLGRLPAPIVPWRLTAAGTYKQIPQGADGSYRSEVLRLDMRVEKDVLSLRDTVSGEQFQDPPTMVRMRRRAEARANDAEARANDAEARADTAEARVRELEELLQRSANR